jgi:hypothetical protein
MGFGTISFDINVLGEKCRSGKHGNNMPENTGNTGGNIATAE